MNPVQSRIAMKLSPDSPELTAYALGELDPATRAEVETALAESPELRAELESIRRFTTTLTAQLATEPLPVLSAEQRAVIARAAETATDLPTAAEPAPKASRQNTGEPWARVPWWRVLLRPGFGVAFAGAAALTLGIFFWQRTPRSVSDIAAGDFLATNAAELKSSPPALGAPAATPPSDAPAKAMAGRPLAGSVADDKSNRTWAAGKTEILALGTPIPQEPAREDFGLRGASPGNARERGEVRLREVEERVPGLVAAAPPAEFGGVPASQPPSSAQPSQPLPPVLAKSAMQDVFALQVPPKDFRELAVSESLADGMLAGVRPTFHGEGYAAIVENAFQDVRSQPLSTFGLEVDTASYANVRRFLREGRRPPPDAVRLEELINYFPYAYAAPKGDAPFAFALEVATCPWAPEHRLVRIGLRTPEATAGERPRANLVFLIDVSGSMEPENKLPLVKRSLRLLLDQLSARDRVGIVTYAGEARVALEPTNAAEKEPILAALDRLVAGSGTHGSAGIQQAYAMATNHFIPGGINRVILCTDGDFNIGMTSREQLLELITRMAGSGVFLSVLGYGMDNYQDTTTELLADRGNGNYAYIDSFAEARKVLREELQGTLHTVAKDTKLQIEFNPARVASWRLLGYENRRLAARDFNDDTKDAGEIGAGLTVTALYEIVPAGGIGGPGVDPLRYAEKPAEPKLTMAMRPDELLFVKLRYKKPDADRSQLIEVPLNESEAEWPKATADFKFAAAVAGYGLLLRDSPHKGTLTWSRVLELAEQGLGPDRDGYRAEFIDLARKASQLGGGR
jgi:Ca-activated chloride channel homolog